MVNTPLGVGWPNMPVEIAERSTSPWSLYMETRWSAIEITANSGRSPLFFDRAARLRGRSIAEAITHLLAVGRRFAGSVRLARLAETLPAIAWVGSLEQQHPPWIL